MSFRNLYREGYNVEEIEKLGEKDDRKSNMREDEEND